MPAASTPPNQNTLSSSRGGQHIGEAAKPRDAKEVEHILAAWAGCEIYDPVGAAAIDKDEEIVASAAEHDVGARVAGQRVVA